MTPEDYLATLVANLQPEKLATEQVPVEDSLGRMIATDLPAIFSVPPFTNSAMDGFAVRSDDFDGDGPWLFDVIRDIPAGADAANAATPGQRTAARIMTGAPVPAWADAVVKVEDTDAPRGASEAPATVTIHAAPEQGKNVRHAGEDIPAGTPAIPAGTPVTARVASSLVSLGYGEIPVVRRPKVAIIATGAELVPPGQPLRPGAIPDSNSTLLAGLIREAGGEPIMLPPSGDTAQEFERSLAEAAAQADLIVTSGGVSMGAFDPVKEYGLAHEWVFEKVAMQPGKPQGHGFAPGNRVGVISLPGNPVSVAVSFTLFVRPILRRLLGTDPAPRVFWARAGVDWSSAKDRRQYLPAKLVSGSTSAEPSSFEPGGMTVIPVHQLNSGSHLVASLFAAEVLAVVSETKTQVTAGDLVQVQIL